MGGLWSYSLAYTQIGTDQRQGQGAGVQGRLNSNVVTGGIAKEAVAEVMLGLLSGQRKMESSGVHAASLVALRCMLWELLNLRKAGIQWLVGRETMAVNWKAS